MGTLVLLDLMGGVALLLWGLHMVQSGILRAFGSDLRHFLSRALGNRFSAFLAGLGLTALLQSSTATGLMTAVAACLGLFLLLRPDAEPAVRFVYIDRPVSDQPPTPPESPAPRPAPEREAATAPAAMAALSYWQLQEIAARHGVESLPEQRAPAAAGPAPVAATTSVWQGHSRPTMASSFFHAGVE